MADYPREPRKAACDKCSKRRMTLLFSLGFAKRTNLRLCFPCITLALQTLFETSPTWVRDKFLDKEELTPKLTKEQQELVDKVVTGVENRERLGIRNATKEEYEEWRLKEGVTR